MASSESAEKPAFLIVVGPNGSGKSGAYERSDARFDGRTFWIVNPDRLTARLSQIESLPLRDANIAAVTRIEAWLEASIAVHKTIGVETVLSTGKYRRLVDQAKVLGFEIWLLYVVLETPDLNVSRVDLRVRKGGHAVAEADIRSRYARSLAQLPWFIDHADRAWLYDNSSAELRLVGVKRDGTVTIDPSAPAVLIQALSI